MYMDKMLSVGKVDNGYVVEVSVPFKPKKEKERGELCEGYPGSKDKKFVAKDRAEAATLVQKLIPMLDEKFSSESEFDAAFDKAAE